MKDRFKFRVFNKKNKKMFVPDYLSNDGEKGYEFNPCVLEYDYNYCLALFDFNDVLMQSTGIYDKNGKLIFESDIVRYKLNEINNESLETHSFAEVKWNHVGLCYSDFLIYEEELEVVGNIYENKELLK